jgi:hypothetical protein
MRASFTSGRAIRMLGAAAVGALVLTASACGGGSGGQTTTAASATGTQSTVQWAGGVCSAFSAWQASLASITKSFKGGQPSKAALQSAGQDLSGATTQLTNSLKQLETPGTAAGQSAKNDIDALQNQLQKNINKIQQAVKPTADSSAASSLAALSTVSGVLASMANNFEMVVASLKQHNAKGQLQQAFQQAPACSKYFSS